MQPEYIHVLLNPVPVYGMAMGVFALALALMARSRSAEKISLVLILAVCATTWVAFHYGERGYDRVYAMSSPDAQKWLDVHAERASRLVWLFGLAAAGAVLGLVLAQKGNRFTTPVLGLVLFFSFAALIAAGWISQAGGRVRHSEFRSGPP